MITLSLTETQVLSALRSFLLAVLPAGTEVIKAQVNRVPEPKAADFVVMTPLLRSRLATNLNVYADAALTGSIAGTTLTVEAVEFGAIVIGAPIYGDGVAAGTSVTAIGQAPGAYTISPAQSVTSRKLFAGTGASRQATQVTIQIDVHGPASADNVQRISTLLRDDLACQVFTATGLDVQPLFAGEPRQAPFLNGQSQVEYRWTVDAVLQANPVVTAPQQFAAEVDLSLNPTP